ncbi:MAG: hypothetical protein HYX78_01745 [Armatimonadetes bacterium]|nr:hypothetical protein [Armatimonadota bacterium]
MSTNRRYTRTRTEIAGSHRPASLDRPWVPDDISHRAGYATHSATRDRSSSQRTSRKGVDKLLLTAVSLLLIGVIGTALGGGRFFHLLLGIGGLASALWIIIHWPTVLPENDIMDRWDVLIPGGRGRGWQILRDTQRLIAQSGVPNVRIEHRDVSTGVLQGFLGGKRPFVIVSHGRGLNLTRTRMFIGCRSYGTSLQVAWYLVQQPGLYRQQDGAKRDRLLGLGVFGQGELRAFASTVDRSVRLAIEEVMLDLMQDPASVDRQSEGFLGIS